MNLIKNTLDDFRPTSLEDLNGLKLLKRYDTKFTFHKSRLKNVLDYLSRDYRILEIGGRRLFSYETLYYDTDDFFFYHQHHNRSYGRYKVRCRRYVESNQCFFEVKFKNNKKKTIKNRIPLNEKSIRREISESSKEFARSHILMNDIDIMEKIKPKLKVDYHRMTFANFASEERFTIDIGLTYSEGTPHHRRLDGLVIAEHKSERPSPNAPLLQYLKSMEIHPVGFSKYCVGVALTEENIKYNRFKKKILALKKMIEEI
jgi:hypothetical protein